MKLRAFLAALAAASLASLVSCVPSTLPELKSSEKQLSSLAILASDNPEAGLGADYEFTWNRNRQAFVCYDLAPFDADLSELVARFAVSEGATVSIGGALVETGVTPIDFRAGALFEITAEDGSSVELLALLGQEPPPPAAGPLGVNVTVVSYNAEDFGPTSSPTYAAVASMLKTLSAEVVVLTETKSDTILTPSDVAGLQAELEAAGWAMPYYAAAVAPTTSTTDEFQDDIVVLSKYEIVDSREITPAGYWPRPGIEAKLKVARDDDPDVYAYLIVFGFHLKAMDDSTSLSKRIAQASAFASYLRTTYASVAGAADPLDSGYFLVAGDMNTVSDGDRGSATSTLGYLRLLDDADPDNDFWAVNEALLGSTPTYITGTEVLDHIILSPALAARYVGGTVDVVDYVPDVPVGTLSDHYPVLLELAL